MTKPHKIFNLKDSKGSWRIGEGAMTAEVESHPVKQERVTVSFSQGVNVGKDLVGYMASK